jgi:glycosyltransferase involved in cell wall biosynthesis
VRAYHLASGLSRHADVTLLSFGDGPKPPDRNLELRSIEPTPAGRVTGNLRSPNPTIPLQTRLFTHSAMRKAVTEELAKGPDVVHVTLARMGGYMPAPAPGLHRHLDLVDSLSINMRTRSRASRGPSRAVFAAEARLMARYEAHLAADADSVSLVSGADRAAPGLADATVIPNGIDTADVPFALREAGRAPVLAFFGNLGYFHNAEPARFVAAEVLPLVRDEVASTTLRLAGARPSAAVRQLETLDGVEVHADVPDMGAELSQATVAVLPMFTGSGLKNKVLEAFSSGLPVVANRMGMDGVEGAAPGIHYLAAETAQEFATSAVSLLEDPSERESLARAARELVGERYSWERQVESLLELYGA